MDELRFLKSRLPTLGTSEQAKRALMRTEGKKRRAASTEFGATSDPTIQRIAALLDRLEYVVCLPDERRERNLSLLRSALQREVLLTAHEVHECVPSLSSEQSEAVAAEQRRSMDRWINYLTSPDVHLPSWFRLYAFGELLGAIQTEKPGIEIGRRILPERDSTGMLVNQPSVAPFPDLHRVSLAATFDVLEAARSERPLPKIWSKLAKQEFASIYAHFLEEERKLTQEADQPTLGAWRRFSARNPDEWTTLVNALRGKVGWQSEREYVASDKLARGDVHVFFSFRRDQLDANGVPLVGAQPEEPRVEIHVVRGRIASTTGRYSADLVEPALAEILLEKQIELTTGDDGFRLLREAKQVDLALDVLRTEQAESLLNPAARRKALRLLYEIDEELSVCAIFGKGSRRAEVRAWMLSRDVKADLSEATGVSKDAISTNGREFLANLKTTRLHWGDLYLEGDVVKDGEIAPGLTVLGSLSVCSSPLEHLPSGLCVHGHLIGSGSRLRLLPSDLVVRSDIIMSDTPLEALSDGFFARRNLVINRCPSLTRLPERLHVEKDLVLDNFPIGRLPATLSVKGDVVVTDINGTYRMDVAPEAIIHGSMSMERAYR